MRGAIKKDKRAVSAVVTFILLATVAMMFLGSWLTIVVPQWGSEEEEDHIYKVQNQMIGIRSSIKALVEADNTNYVVPNYLKLGTEGAAWRGVARANGDMLFDPNPLSTSTFEHFDPAAPGVVSKDMVSKGNLVYGSLNTYYPDQKVVFENGAIIKDQDDGSIMIAPPDFTAQWIGNEVSVDMTFVSLTGNKDTISGNIGVITYTRLASREYNNFDWSGNNQNIVITVESDYPTAWRTFFELYMLDAGFDPDPGSVDADGEFEVSMAGDTVTLEIANVDSLRSTHGVVDIWFG